MSYFERILLFPLGSYEYHGHHLPAETDAIIASQFTSGIATKLQQTFKGTVCPIPAMPYGLSLEHEGLPTTAYVLHTTFFQFVKEIAATVTSPKDLLVMINGHGGNTATLSAMEGEFNCTFQDKKLYFPTLFPGPVKDLCNSLVGEYDVHAGSVEASLLAYYGQKPAREYQVKLYKRVRGSLRFFRTAEIAPEGVIKNTSTVIADPEKGKALHDAVVRHAAQDILGATDNLGSVILRENR